MSLARPIMLFVLLLLSALAASPQPAKAQPAWTSPNIAAALEVEGPVRPGGETTLAIRFTPVSSEWHGYWSNPGDAGLGMTVDWNLPEGVTIGAFEYPTPQRLLIDGLMNHVFEGEYAVLAPLRLSADGPREGAFTVEGLANYLACTDKICVPEQARLTARVEIGTGPRDTGFAQYRSEIPPVLDSPGRFEPSGQMLRIAIALPAGIEIGQPHVFVQDKDVVDYAAPQGFARDGDNLIATLPLADMPRLRDRIGGILKLSADSEEGRGLRFEAVPGAVPDAGNPILPVDRSMPAGWIVILGAFVGGLLLNIMPCVFPILSLKALSLARAGESAAQARADGLAYTAGAVIACIALGALMLVLRAAGEQVGWAFQLQEPGVVVALFILAGLITANFAGLFELPTMPIRKGGQPLGAFATGLLAAVAATPCTGPFMAAAIGAALLLPAATALGVFAALGLGLALPFLLLGFVPALRRMLPSPGSWMSAFRKILAIPMGLTAAALGWLLIQLGGIELLAIAGLAAVAAISLAFVLYRRQLPVLAWVAGLGLVMAVGAVRAAPVAQDHQSARSASILDPRPFSEAGLAEARATGRPVFVWFTADWCVTCKVNERIAIEREATRDAFEQAGVIAMVGDWTRRDAEISQFLSDQGVAGVPLYLYYPANAREAERLPQILGPDTLVKRAGISSRPAQPRAVQ